MTTNVTIICTALAMPAASQEGIAVHVIRAVKTAHWITKVTATITAYSETCRTESDLLHPKVHHLFRQKCSATAGG